MHGVEGAGLMVLRKRLTRGRLLAFFADLPRCRVGLKACAGAHHWAA